MLRAAGHRGRRRRRAARRRPARELNAAFLTAAVTGPPARHAEARDQPRRQDRDGDGGEPLDLGRRPRAPGAPLAGRQRRRRRRHRHRARRRPAADRPRPRRARCASPRAWCSTRRRGCRSRRPLARTAATPRSIVLAAADAAAERVARAARRRRRGGRCVPGDRAERDRRRPCDALGRARGSSRSSSRAGPAWPGRFVGCRGGRRDRLVPRADADRRARGAVGDRRRRGRASSARRAAPGRRRDRARWATTCSSPGGCAPCAGGLRADVHRARRGGRARRRGAPGESGARLVIAARRGAARAWRSATRSRSTAPA